MGRTIDADALKSEIVKRLGISDRRYLLPAEKTIWDIINDMPTVEERKTGRWIEVHGFCTPGGDPVWACSECGKGIHVYGIEHGTYGADVSDGQWKACPNCGAKMEG